MSDIDNRYQGRMNNSKRKSDAVGGDPAFERWLARQMHEMYDEVLAEEVPAELLRVVDRATGKTPAKSGPAKNGNGSVDHLDVPSATPDKAKRKRR